MKQDVLLERFFTALISGDRHTSRQIIDELRTSDCTAEKMLSNLVWPTLEHIQTLHRNDELSDLSYQYATQMLRMIVSQMQLRLERKPIRAKKVLLVCGPEPSEELAAQIVVDLLDANGYEVYYAGGGVANDEIVSEIGKISADAVVVFGVIPSTVPFTRLLVDRLHNIGICPNLQVIVGGGVFARAEGLAEEIGADLWANSPEELVEAMTCEPNRRMTSDQRTVGRKRRTQKKSKEAA